MNPSEMGFNSVFKLLQCFIIVLGGDEMTKRIVCTVISSEPLHGPKAQAEKMKTQPGPISNTAMHQADCEGGTLAVIAHDFAGATDLSESGPSEASGPYHPKAKNSYGMMLNVLA